jgi:hypothetical protein
MGEDRLITRCEDCLYLIDVNSMRVAKSLKIKDSNSINDISKTGEQGVYGLARS